ncbi:glutamate--tRNA ligase [Pseudomonas sp. MAP12]|uniref:Glutamate--tRNA ligase n=1 Tax=Geopseudomonas aromaticivorans TaxID=2849492 RepID=A0ABS6N0Q0_9GAMM|nr:glutamate--tRNA ligase [Pseudomonas aromaticivorans]MBV2134628.1 glutamate--tRNA ligase [Pseudomonas aromaticivorans]
MTTVRTRIAPSPTGDPHVGTAYIALFNLCFARQHGGQFILRIEDTDQLRSTRESEQQIYDALRWLGIEWDEGPDVGGPHGPYRQSERGHIYKQYSDELVAKGHAFPCFCSAERLDAVRAEQMANKETPRYDGHCMHIGPQQAQQRVAAGEAHVVRMKVPTEGVCVVPDMLRGEVEIPWDRMDMQVLMKTDGLPTYFLANVVDDHLMGITHVLRGEEWLPSAPKLIKLYEYFGWEQPVLCYMPLLRNPDKSKLSKRKNPTSVTFYQRMGYLPEAMLNYLGRMGWSMPDEREKFSLAEMIEHFDVSRVSLGGPIFDVDKLSWLNGQWLRELPLERFAAEVQKWALNPQYLMQIAPHVQNRVETFSQLAPLAGFFFMGGVSPDAKLFEHKKLSPEQVRQVLQLILWKLEALRQWNKDNITAIIQKVAEHLGLKLRDLMPLIFPAISGQASSVSVLDAMEILGPDLSRFRLRQAVELLGGVSKKETKEWEKLLAAID